MPIHSGPRVRDLEAPPSGTVRGGCFRDYSLFLKPSRNSYDVDRVEEEGAFWILGTADGIRSGTARGTEEGGEPRTGAGMQPRSLELSFKGRAT